MAPFELPGSMEHVQVDTGSAETGSPVLVVDPIRAGVLERNNKFGGKMPNRKLECA